MTVVEGGSRVDPLMFSIDLGRLSGGSGTTTDEILDYVAKNTNGFVFAAHILGFTDLNLQPEMAGCVDSSSPDEDWSPECNILTSVFVTTDSLTPVPVPAAVWLFGSGLLGLVDIARRRRTA